MEHDIGRLETSIKELSDRLTVVAEQDDWIEIIRLTKTPGWTTPAEFLLVNTVVDTITLQVEVIDRLKGELLNANRQIAETAEREAATA